MEIKKLSKFLSLILRHKPEAIGITLDEHGWADVEELLQKINETGRNIDLPLLEKIVAENDKQRFSFSADMKKIRANQGHSIHVDVELKQVEPPDVLYHGTIEKNRTSIEVKGLIKGNRLYVHLSKDIETAIKVANRRKGKNIIYKVSAGEMYNDGFLFYQSVNGVWLTDRVPAKYLSKYNE
jgi:putative RNA 2'-phosphotransferase